MSCIERGEEVNWQEVKEEPTTKSSQLPKLTAEVFNRTDCPEWARYAAVNDNGTGTYFENEPEYDGYLGCWLRTDKRADIIKGKFDSSDWQNSLIERHTKALPDWCKEGKQVYDIASREYICVRKEDYGWYIDNIEIGRIKQARKRPFNEKEMRGLVGKVIEDVKGDATLITDFNNCTKSIRVLGEWVQSDDLANSTWKLNSKPCFVLEYLNGKGEWVK
jgi:hypothetical protein